MVVSDGARIHLQHLTRQTFLAQSTGAIWMAKLALGARPGERLEKGFPGRRFAPLAEGRSDRKEGNRSFWYRYYHPLQDQARHREEFAPLFYIPFPNRWLRMCSCRFNQNFAEQTLINMLLTFLHEAHLIGSSPITRSLSLPVATCR